MGRYNEQQRLKFGNTLWWIILIIGVILGVRFARLLGLVIVIIGILVFFAVKEGLFKNKR
jgi:Zn-dependent membrane protease YugP